MKLSKTLRLWALAMAAGLAFFLSACGKNYSNGTRIGVITKLSQKGLVFDSWEGELLMALPAEIATATRGTQPPTPLICRRATSARPTLQNEN